MRLNELKPADGAKRERMRVGRGIGSGKGKTGGRGYNGQKSRSGGYHKVGFEGGQMPIARRLPKRGFTSMTRDDTREVRLSDLNKLEGSEVDLLALGVIQTRAQNPKCLSLILVLRFLVLLRDDDAARHMGDAHRRICRIDRLSTRPRRTEHINAQVFLVDLNIDLLGLRHDGNRRRRGMDATARFCDRNSLYPMHAGFKLETGEGVSAID